MIPSDPIMLMSYLNTKLRDEYDSLEELCAALDVEREDIEQTLAAAGFCYDAARNKFC